MIRAKNIENRKNGNVDWYISNKNQSECYLINCTQKELNHFLLNHNFEEGTYEVFKYRSDEYWMFILGDEYNVNVNYNKK